MHRKAAARLFALTVASSLALVAACDQHYRRRDRYREDEVRARCGKIMDRIATDHQKLDDIEPGRHEKARDWFENDLRDAEHDLDRCREQRRLSGKSRRYLPAPCPVRHQTSFQLSVPAYGISGGSLGAERFKHFAASPSQPLQRRHCSPGCFSDSSAQLSVTGTGVDSARAGESPSPSAETTAKVSKSREVMKYPSTPIADPAGRMLASSPS